MVAATWGRGGLPWARPASPFWGAVVWGLVVEGLLLATPYAAFFQLHVNARFLFLTASAHLVFGLALGAWLRRRLG
ncbi:hypothetical protein DYH09_26520 [bacterium CPR1]|nr:hypothetical protein [bacterium CPR1]